MSEVVVSVRCEDCERKAAEHSYECGFGVSEWEAFLCLVPECEGCRRIARLMGTTDAERKEPQP